MVKIQQKNIIMIIFIIVIFIFLLNQGFFIGAIHQGSYSTLSQCNAARETRLSSWELVSDCEQVTQGKWDCVWNKGWVSPANVGEYYYMYADNDDVDAPIYNEGYDTESYYKCIISEEWLGINQCSDSDMGRVYNIGGTVQVERDGYNDLCVNSNTLREWYCDNGQAVSEDISCSTDCVGFPGSCIAGTQGCTIPGDTPPSCDGIDRTELGNVISQWLNDDITRTQLGQAIHSWIGG